MIFEPGTPWEMVKSKALKASSETNILVVKIFHNGEVKNFDLKFGEKSTIKSDHTVRWV